MSEERGSVDSLYNTVFLGGLLSQRFVFWRSDGVRESCYLCLLSIGSGIHGAVLNGGSSKVLGASEGLLVSCCFFWDFLVSKGVGW